MQSKKIWGIGWLAALALLWAGVPAGAQDVQSVAVAFSDPSRPGVLEVEQTHGSIRVIGYTGSEVRVEARVRTGEEQKGEGGEDRDWDWDPGDEDEAEELAGLVRWGAQSIQLEVVEENNFMQVEVGTSWSKIVDLTIQVPTTTSLQLECVHGGDISVEGVVGELELSNTHGSISAKNVGGSVVAETTHGDVDVEISQVAAGRPMAFSTFHGDVDVTLPADVRAEVLIDSGNAGEVYTNFEIAKVALPAEVREQREGRRTRVTIERETRGTINGGGPEMSFKTWNGSIRIRKGA